MGVIILAINFATLVLLPFVWMVIRFSKRRPVQVFCIIACGIAWILISNFAFQFLLEQTIKFGIDVPYSDVPEIELPQDASSVSYYRIYSSTRLVAQFTISEAGFREWMRHHGRPVAPIANPVVVLQLDSESPPNRSDLEIVSGLHWDDYDKADPSDDSGTTIVFDDQRNRAYIVITDW